MLNILSLKFGSSTGEPPLSFSPGPMTIFVGSNNAGKSLILREIEQSLISKQGNYKGIIIEPLEFKPISAERLRQLFPSPMRDGTIYLRNPISGRQVSTSKQVYVRMIQDIYERKTYKNLKSYLHPFFSTYTFRLDGEARLKLTRDLPSGDLQGPPQNLLQALFQDEVARKQLRNLTHEAFSSYFTIDPTGMGQLRIRMSPTEPKGEERSLNSDAVEFFRRAKHISEFSDGVKAFVGIIATVLCAPYMIMLIDEPEAFLHPPLVRRLGKTLTELASDREGHMLASTHSSDFLMGCIQSRREVDVVRLTYKEDIPTARLLSSEKLQKMMRDPFLRSTGILSALFYLGTVVCEADMDRAFYQEANERLLEAHQMGIKDGLFLNANGKDSIGRIVRPLREMGIPATFIVDLDIIEKGNFVDLLRSAFVPEELITSWRVVKDSVYSKFKEMGLKPKEVGLDVLDVTDREIADSLSNSLAEYGIFVVTVGEIERWLPELQINKNIHGPNWLAEAFVKMGNDPTDPQYVRPKEGDVWDFIKRISAWIANPNRKGIPV